MSTTMPRAVRQAISRAATLGDAQKTLSIMEPRKREFDNPLTHKLIALASSPYARENLEDALDAIWAKQLVRDADEIVVGGGFHAAAYCAIRVQQGFPRPLVIEASTRPGGVFARSKGPAFYLNSRNRPGYLGIPGTEGALNVLPGAIIQPADLSGDEYQRNSDLAFCIRMTLAMNADVLAGVKVQSVSRRNSEPGGYKLMLSDGTIANAKRVIFATGLGDERELNDVPSSDRIMSFLEFVKHMDRPFPLQGMRRVAVIGVGDSGRTVIEALTGQGPTTGMSVASLDYPAIIDWYGLRSVAVRRGDWENCNRSRYRGIGRLLPKTSDTQSAVQRLFPKPLATRVAAGYQCAYVNETPYDYVISCIGFESSGAPAIGDWEPFVWESGGRAVALSFGDEDVFKIGPAATIELGTVESDAIGGGVPENSTALFRYSARTATLAASLEAPTKAVVKKSVEGKLRISEEVDGRPKLDLLFDREGKPLIVGEQYDYFSPNGIFKWMGVLIGSSGNSGNYPVFVRADGYGTTRIDDGTKGFGIARTSAGRLSRSLRNKSDLDGAFIRTGVVYRDRGGVAGTMLGIVNDSNTMLGLDVDGYEGGGSFMVGTQKAWGIAPSNGSIYPVRRV